jgi:hypothetical protein
VSSDGSVCGENLVRTVALVRFSDPAHLRLPRIGPVKVFGPTRKVRRTLDLGRFHIYSATMTERVGRWTVSLTEVAAERHQAERSRTNRHAVPVGVDRGIISFCVAADAHGSTPKPPTFSTESALFVGDTHGDAGWLKFVVLPTTMKMGISTIIQVGDFDYWPDSRKFMQIVKTAREKFGVDILFIDGNHEHFTKLDRDVRAAQVVAGAAEGDRDPVKLAPGLVYLPRGSRVTVAGRSVASVGGAASIDRADRVEGKSWFPEERISDLDIGAVAARGHADILITHDAPSGWTNPESSPTVH